MAVSRYEFGLQTFLHSSFDFGNFRAVPSFLAGMAIAAVIADIKPIKLPWNVRLGHSSCWLIAHGFAAIILVSMLAYAPEPLIFAMFPVAVMLIALAERSGAPTFLARPLFVRLGECSFGIYLLHPFVAIAVALVLRRFGWTNLPCLLLGTVAGIILSILIARTSFRWFETPVRRLLSGSYPSRPHKLKSAVELAASQTEANRPLAQRSDEVVG